MNLSIISIGDELLIGQVVNRNAAWISEQVTEIGALVHHHIVVGDSAEDLQTAITRLSTDNDVIIMTGGLGPTHDDITKQVLTDVAHDTLIVDDRWLDHLSDWMRRRGRELSDRNAEQALVPSTATVVINDVGTAPGLMMTIDNTMVIALPGVPAEMRSMMMNHLLPMFQKMIEEEGGSRWQYHVIQTTGIAESDLADILHPVDEWLGSSSLAFLPNARGVRLRVGVNRPTTTEREEEIARIDAEIERRAGRFIFARGNVSLAQAVGLRLRERNETVSVAESCTGGMLGAAFTDIEGSSAWFEGGVLSYSNTVKVNHLGVSQQSLDAEGAVSEIVARQMAEGVRTRLQTTWGIGVTGIAGPGGGSEEKPVGTVWIAVSDESRTIARRFSFGTDRSANRERSVGAALAMLWGMIR